MDIDYGMAKSFVGLVPPNEAIEVERQTVGSNTYIYYQDKEGNLYYNSTNGIAFEREMQERRLVSKMKKRMGI